MNVYQMLDRLGVRIEDASKVNFNDTLKLEILKNNELELVNLLHPAHLTALEYTKEDLDISADGEAGVAGVANLTAAALGYNVAKGKEGVIKVKIHGGLYLIEKEVEDLKDFENQYKGGTALDPRYWIFQNKIYVLPTTITNIDVSFLRLPTPLLYKFSMFISGGGTTTGFIGASDEGLNDDTDQYYKGAVIYSTKHNSYHVVTNFNYASRLFVVSPSASSIFSTGYKFFFLTHDFDQLNLDGVTSDLNPALHGIIVDLAEAECWAMDAKPERHKLAREKAYAQINVLNASVTSAEGSENK